MPTRGLLLHTFFLNVHVQGKNVWPDPSRLSHRQPTASPWVITSSPPPSLSTVVLPSTYLDTHTQRPGDQLPSNGLLPRPDLSSPARLLFSPPLSLLPLHLPIWIYISDSLTPCAALHCLQVYHSPDVILTQTGRDAFRCICSIEHSDKPTSAHLHQRRLPRLYSSHQHLQPSQPMIIPSQDIIYPYPDCRRFCLLL